MLNQECKTPYTPNNVLFGKYPQKNAPIHEMLVLRHYFLAASRHAFTACTVLLQSFFCFCSSFSSFLKYPRKRKWRRMASIFSLKRAVPSSTL